MSGVVVVPEYVEQLMRERAARLCGAIGDEERTRMAALRNGSTVDRVGRALIEAWAEGVQYEMQLLKETLPHLGVDSHTYLCDANRGGTCNCKGIER